MPDLIEVQKNSYRRFLEVDMREVLDDVSPIVDYTENLSLEFVDYSLDEPKNSVSMFPASAYSSCSMTRE